MATAVGQFTERAGAEQARDALVRAGFGADSLEVVEDDGILLIVDTDAVHYADACLILRDHGAELRSERAVEDSGVVQGVGASPGAACYPDPPAAMVNDDPGLVDTPVQTRTGTTATTGQTPTS